MRVVTRNRPFMLFAAGQTVSLLGDKLDYMALIGLVGAVTTGSESLWTLASLALSFALPVLVFGPIAGRIADRCRPRPLLVGAELLRAVLVASIPFTYRAAGSVWPIYPTVCAVFAVGLVFNAGKMALIPDLVDRRHLLEANALMNVTGRVATVIGMVAGGWVVEARFWSAVGWPGYQAGFLLDALSYIFSAWTMAVVVPRGAARAVRSAVEQQPAGVWRDIADAWRIVRADPILVFTFASIVLAATTAGGAYVLVVVLANGPIGLGTAGLGLLAGIGAAGMITGALVLGTYGAAWPRPLVAASGCLAIGVLMAWGGWTFEVPALAGIAVLGGAAMAMSAIAQDTLLHELAPAGIRGRVFALRDAAMTTALAGGAIGGAGLATLLAARGTLKPAETALSAIGLGAAVAAVVMIRAAWRHAPGAARI